MAETSQLDIRRLENKIDGLSKQINNNAEMINTVGNLVNDVQNELEQLRVDFENMVNEQRRTAAIQQATTELVRVRQELERTFGNYKIVRETMLGVLQATDSALVKEDTISRVSEELMLSTPRYWLAPVLVAVSAWIANDRDLADRAIKEAVKRDEERTALTMALICRRNKRINTCYEWLNIYFSKQKAHSFTEANYTFLNAYINNVFGPDENHLCDDYLAKWLNEIKGNSSNFEEEQKATWKEFCDRYTVDFSAEYPAVSNNIVEIEAVKNYYGRIEAVEPISETFSGINNAVIDSEKLKEEIDDYLMTLVSSYDKDEEQLVKEERLYCAIKENGGNRELAVEQLARRDSVRQITTMNLVEQMTSTITSGRDVHPSEKKTAMSFLSSYIRKGFEQYITEKKEAFPKTVTITMNGWNGQTEDGNNANALYADYENAMQMQRQQALSQVNTKKPIILWIAAAVLAVLGLVLLPVGVIGIIAAVVCVILGFNEKKNISNTITNINADYDRKIIDGKNDIYQTICQWCELSHKVSEFNDEPIRDITA